jgi:hypothetical protein
MRRRVIGATLTILGALVLLFGPVHVVQRCVYSFDAGVCGGQGASSWWGLVDYPAGWERLALLMLVFGFALVVTGIVLLIKARRSFAATRH